MALPGVILLIIFIYGRPQEFNERLATLPFLYLWLGMAFAGMGAEIGMGKARLKAAPHLKASVFILFWSLFTLGIFNPSELSGNAVIISVTWILFFVVGHSTESLKGFQKLTGTVLAMGLFVATVAVHQGFSSFQCIAMVPIPGARADTGIPDGRSCDSYRDCRDDPTADPETEYLCERIGLFQTTTITAGRVRWRGVLQDPNELALTAGISLPFAFAFFEQKRTFSRLLILVYALLMIGTCIVLTQSRGGQLVFTTVLGVYFIKKYGLKGAVIGAVCALPLILLGGRGSQEAEESANERSEILAEGLMIWRAFPLTGCGFRQFTEHFWLTAHNAYLLAISELGPFGFFAWLSMIYLTFKISLTALKRYENVPGPTAASIKAWATALMASFAGMLVGIFFLSFTYHYVLWIYFGLSSALYFAIRGADPTFKVQLDRKDVFRIIGIELALVTAIFGYVKSKGLM
ncbi:O-antigen ligase family protein [Chondromyces crocatus]|uniref:O-antigen polymerase n=1 Tax=Chondromyces crocatus TaxID=52 RepID=A0A0K1EAA0_CHOCO|nr:O-antigen ligase family protein [Chondromyces crocatus]AKT37779.1 O-antigen polymerase [Chondromyces crocatus]